MLDLILPIESIPRHSWGKSLAHNLPRHKWDAFRKEVYRLSGYTCVACGNTKKKLHCHESWIFDDANMIQYLDKVRCLCVTCHRGTHFLRSIRTGSLSRLRGHFIKVNKLTKTEFQKYFEELMPIIEKRKENIYKISIGSRASLLASCEKYNDAS
jgi:hypothetical protein